MAKKEKKVVVIDDLSKQFEEHIEATEVVVTPDIVKRTDLQPWALSNVEKITFRGKVSWLLCSFFWKFENLEEIVFEKECLDIDAWETLFDNPKLRKLTFKEGISYLPVSDFGSNTDFDKFRINIAGETRTINEWCKTVPDVFGFYDLGLPSETLWDMTFRYVIHGDSDPVEPSIEDIFELLSYHRLEPILDVESDETPQPLIGYDHQMEESICLYPTCWARFIIKISQSLRRGKDDTSAENEGPDILL